ncbi:MAG: cation:proton antiporter [Burkholderiaceae bacterium]
MDLSFLPDWPIAWPAAMAVAILALFAAVAGEVAGRWLRVPRLLGYVAAGALFGAGGYVVQWLKIEELPIRTMQFSMNFAAAVILFDVGQRVSFGWVRRNPALLGASVVESALTFVGVYVAMQALEIAPLASALIAAISMSTSPAVVLAVTRELRAQGQVTERTLLLTALNSIYAVVLSTLLLAWARVQTRGVLDDYLLHPAYLIVGSLALAAIGARVFLAVVGFVGRDRAEQIMVMLAVVWIVFSTADALKLSPLLALLACGAFVRTFDDQRLLARTDIGLASAVALALFFALSAAVVDLDVLFAAWLPALALVLVRSVCKVAAVGALSPLTGIAWRKGLLTGIGLLPMSALALMLTQEVSLLNPQVGAQTGAVLLLSVVILQVVGALTLMFALRASDEARTDGVRR